MKTLIGGSEAAAPSQMGLWCFDEYEPPYPQISNRFGKRESIL